MNENKPIQEQQPKPPAQEPLRARTTEPAPAAGYAHGLSELAHQQFLAFERRFGRGKTDK